MKSLQCFSSVAARNPKLDYGKVRRTHSSRVLRPGSNVCSEHMNDWQYLSQGDLIEGNEFFSKSKS